MTEQQSRAEFAVSDEVIGNVLSRHQRESFSLSDPKWQTVHAEQIGNRRLGRRRWLRRLLTTGRNGREQDQVRATYEEHWGRAPTVEHVSAQDTRVVAMQWRDRGYLAAPQVQRQVHLLYLARAIEVLAPRRVLEVGAGNGNVLLTLAAHFPEVSFAGGELTAAGVEAVHALQANEQLPDSFAATSPIALRDPTAHRRVDMRVADARNLPFADREFDMVFTRLGLEQMEEIRPAAMSEVTRVAGRAVVLIEPWHDFNRADPGRAYIRRMGYFAAAIRSLGSYGFDVVFATDDLPQKVQYSSGPVVALRR